MVDLVATLYFDDCHMSGYGTAPPNPILKCLLRNGEIPNSISTGPFPKSVDDLE